MKNICSLFSRMTLAEFIQLCTLAVTVITAIILVKTYRRNKKIELQNYFFKLKLEAYQAIVYELEDLFAKLRVVIGDLDDYLSLERTIAKEKLDIVAKQIDKSIIEGDVLISKHSIFFGESVTQLLHKFSEGLYGYYKDEGSLEELLEKLNNYYNSQLALANQINEEIRRELKIGTLNQELFRRY